MNPKVPRFQPLRMAVCMAEAGLEVPSLRQRLLTELNVKVKLQVLEGILAGKISPCVELLSAMALLFKVPTDFFFAVIGDLPSLRTQNKPTPYEIFNVTFDGGES